MKAAVGFESKGADLYRTLKGRKKIVPSPANRKLFV